MIRLRASDGEVRVYADMGINSLPVGIMDVFGTTDLRVRCVWLCRTDYTKICNSPEIMRYAISSCKAGESV